MGKGYLEQDVVLAAIGGIAMGHPLADCLLASDLLAGGSRLWAEQVQRQPPVSLRITATVGTEPFTQGGRG